MHTDHNNGNNAKNLIRSTWIKKNQTRKKSTLSQSHRWLVNGQKSKNMVKVNAAIQSKGGTVGHASGWISNQVSGASCESDQLMTWHNR